VAHLKGFLQKARDKRRVAPVNSFNHNIYAAQKGVGQAWDNGGTAEDKLCVYSELACPAAFGTLGTLAGQTKIKRLVVNTHLKDR